MAIILFDFDGVLADTLEDALNFGRGAAAQVGFERNPTPADLEALETMAVPDYGRQLQIPAQYIEKFVDHYLKMFTQKTSPPESFSGMPQVVAQAAKNHTVAIITGNTTPTVEAFLQKLGLQEHVKLVIGVEYKVSRAEKIRMALRDLGHTDEPVYMIGDSLSDIHAARETSVKSIAVGWGHQSLARLEAAHPDFLVNSPQELMALIETAPKTSY